MLIDFPITRPGIWEQRSVEGSDIACFVPTLLPLNPALSLTTAHNDLLEQANLALGRLDGVTKLLPDTQLFIYNYVRKEAVLSSQIEGTQSSLSDLLLFENDQMPGVPLDDVREVSNYIHAMEYGLSQLRDPNGLPLSTRLLKEMHQRLLVDSRGGDKAPGQFRNSPVWLGSQHAAQAVFVPPPAEYVTALMTNLENFLHDQPARTPTLIKAALAHAQFETVHPFLDGNGRLGRLLITLILCAEDVLAEPMLYLSLYFKVHRQHYYDALQGVRIAGDWEGWLLFFLQGVYETAQQAFEMAQQLITLFSQDREQVQLSSQAGSTLQVLQYIQQEIFLTVAQAERDLPMSAPTIRNAISNLESLGVLNEVTGQRKNRIWCYTQYIAILNKGTEP